MDKKAQASVFVVVGVLIVLAFSLILFFQKNGVQHKEELDVASFSSQSLQVYMGKCLEKTTKEGLLFIGERGGYFSPPQPAKDLYYVAFPYYWDENNTSYAPSLETIEQQAL